MMATNIKRQARVRNKLKARAGGKARLSVFVSNKHIYVQVIDDKASVTLAASSSLVLNNRHPANNISVAQAVGADVAKKAVAAGVSKVVFDRGSRAYHGKIKALAEAARQNGLQF